MNYSPRFPQSLIELCPIVATVLYCKNVPRVAKIIYRQSKVYYKDGWNLVSSAYRVLRRSSPQTAIAPGSLRRAFALAGTRAVPADRRRMRSACPRSKRSCAASDFSASLASRNLSAESASLRQMQLTNLHHSHFCSVRTFPTGPGESFQTSRQGRNGETEGKSAKDR